MRILLVEAEQACLSSLYLALSQHQFGVDWVSQYRRGAIAHLSAATIKISLVVKPMVVAAQSPLTPDDYLQLEAESPIKREYIMAMSMQWLVQRMPMSRLR